MALNIFKKKRRPSPETLAGGIYKCEYCAANLKLADFPPFQYAVCPSCDKLFFAPYRVANYWLYQPLGGGGMGSVYKALDANDPNVDLAVKLLPRDIKDNPEAAKRLLREGEVGKLFGEHPHLTAVLDYGTSDGETYVTMESLTGTRLDILIAGKTLISQRFILSWASQLLAAEKHMVSRGYLYRDLKPQNIIINYAGKARLFDYGLCQTIAEAAKEKKEAETTVGSPQYMPPERLTGEGEAMSSEIYSLGMIIFHALSGKTYYSLSDDTVSFPDTKAVSLLASKHVTEPASGRVLKRLPANIDPAIGKLIDKMLRSRPEERFQTFDEADDAIKKILEKLS